VSKAPISHTKDNGSIRESFLSRQSIRGAGDAFIAGFLTHFLTQGKDVEAAAAYAAQKGAEACTYAGGWGYRTTLTVMKKHRNHNKQTIKREDLV
jgi:fructose-1-phosphate kinase PfkB-like protein